MFINYITFMVLAMETGGAGRFSSSCATIPCFFSRKELQTGKLHGLNFVCLFFNLERDFGRLVQGKEKSKK